jgi:hypothetical protein
MGPVFVELAVAEGRKIQSVNAGGSCACESFFLPCCPFPGTVSTQSEILDMRVGDSFLTIIYSFLVNRDLVVKAMLSGTMNSLGWIIFAGGYSRNRHWQFQM